MKQISSGLNCKHWLLVFMCYLHRQSYTVMLLLLLLILAYYFPLKLYWHFIAYMIHYCIYRNLFSFLTQTPAFLQHFVWKSHSEGTIFGIIACDLFLEFRRKEGRTDGWSDRQTNGCEFNIFLVRNCKHKCAIWHIFF